jgi:2,3-bisphosphoglycerate-independent phosphoglycerate mutase
MTHNNNQNELLNKIEQAKKHITSRQEKEKAEAEAKLLGTAIQQLLGVLTDNPINFPRDDLS